MDVIFKDTFASAFFFIVIISEIKIFRFPYIESFLNRHFIFQLSDINALLQKQKNLISENSKQFQFVTITKPLTKYNNPLRMSDQFNIELIKFSKVALQFINTLKELKGPAQCIRIQASPSPLLSISRNPGFTLAAIMGKANQDQVNADILNQGRCKEEN